MEADAIFTLRDGCDLFNIAGILSVLSNRQHVDDPEGVLFVRSIRIRNGNIYAVCREGLFIDSNPLRLCCIPRHKCNVIERCAVLAPGERSFQFCLDVCDAIQVCIFKALGHLIIVQSLCLYLICRSRNCNVADYVCDRNCVASVRIVDHVTARWASA